MLEGSSLKRLLLMPLDWFQLEMFNVNNWMSGKLLLDKFWIPTTEVRSFCLPILVSISFYFSKSKQYETLAKSVNRTRNEAMNELSRRLKMRNIELYQFTVNFFRTLVEEGILEVIYRQVICNSRSEQWQCGGADRHEGHTRCASIDLATGNIVI